MVEIKQKIKLQFDSSVTQITGDDDRFSKGIMRICYTGKNRNNSYISKETIEKAIPSMYYCPIVCNYNIDDDTIGGHDIEIRQDSEGNYKITNLTNAIGVVPYEANTWWEVIDDTDGQHEYLVAEILIWKRSAAYSKISSDNVVSQSMEIEIKNCSMNDGILIIDSFEFNAFCLLGDGVAPCFESASLEVFSIDSLKQEFSEMMMDLKAFSKMVNSSDEVDDIKIQRKEEDRKMNNNIDYDEANATVETKSTKNFELTENIVEEIHRVLSAEKITITRYGELHETEHYRYVDCDLEAREVYCIDACDWQLYGFNMSISGNVVVIDYESKKRKKYAIVDFDGVEQPSLVAPIVEPMQDEFEQEYSRMSSEISTASEELENLRKYKADIEERENTAKCEEMFAQFSDLAGIEAFENLKADASKFDIDTLEEKCFAIRGRNSSVLRFSVSNNSTKLCVESVDDVSNEPYGGLLKKYAE